MRLSGVVAVIGLCVCVWPALADWNPGDPYKMHYPQLPDPQGWDVNVTYPKVLADDWQCTQTGPVSDIHFWVSTHQWDQPPPIESIYVSIHDDFPGPPFSHPLNLLWDRWFSVTSPSIKIRPYGTGEQGWYNPNTGEWNRPDHFVYYQVNITNIPEPFIQQFGQIYWLDLSIQTLPGYPPVGWKTSLQHFRDDGVWGDFGTTGWQPLRDPITGQTLDLAFVITPEPAGLLLLGLGALTLRRR